MSPPRGDGRRAASGAADPATPEEVLRALADPDRLAVAGILARGPRSAEAIASELGLPADRIRRLLAKLAAVGIAKSPSEGSDYRLVRETLRRAAREVGPQRDPGLALGAVDEDEEAVLRQYFRAGRLREIPVKRAKRLVVLERLALEFDVGFRYSESQVNDVLGRFHDDHASLRRYLVDEGFLSRGGGEYWRTGGRVEV
jgi:hypothetical protein